MNSIVLKAKSSSGEPYDVEFNVTDSIIVRCSCRAGIFGKLCKHKTGLMSGDDRLLFSQADVPKLNELLAIVNRSEYVTLKSNLLEAKKAIDNAKKAETKIKKTIELALKEGISLKTEC